MGDHPLGLNRARAAGFRATGDLTLDPLATAPDEIHNIMHRLWITLYRGFRDQKPLTVVEIVDV
jgi:hypothetical protein